MGKRRFLVVVDVQNDFIDGSLGTPEAVAAIPNIVSKIKEYLAERGNTTNVYTTQDTHFDETFSVVEMKYPNTEEGRNLPVLHCVLGTHGWEINAEVKEALGGHCSNLHKYTFGSVDLAKLFEEIHKSMGSDAEMEIELVGFCTDICIVSNALLIKAFLPNIKIIVDASCCAGVTPENHRKALGILKTCHIKVINE